MRLFIIFVRASAFIMTWALDAAGVGLMLWNLERGLRCEVLGYPETNGWMVVVALNG